MDKTGELGGCVYCWDLFRLHVPATVWRERFGNRYLTCDHCVKCFEEIDSKMVEGAVVVLTEPDDVSGMSPREAWARGAKWGSSMALPPDKKDAH